MKKYITEEELRDIYRKEPFETYTLEKGQRLTPGASQYLSDKMINLIDKNVVKPIKTASITTTVTTEAKVTTKEDITLITESNENNAVAPDNLTAKPCNNDYGKLYSKAYYKLKTIQAKCLVIGNEILKKDIALAQGILSLERKLATINNSINNCYMFDDIKVIECTGMKKDCFYHSLDDCFEISEFHMIFEQGAEILKLNELKCELREVLPLIDELYEGNTNENVQNINNIMNIEEFKIKIIRNLNAIINLLSQLICSAIGGGKCQKSI